MYVYLIYQLNGQFPEKHFLSSWSPGDDDNEWITHYTFTGFCGGRGKKVNFL